MAYDLHGINSRTEAGRHFRLTVLSWPEVARLCHSLAPDLCNRFHQNWTEWGYGLSPEDATALGRHLRAARDNGQVAAWFAQRAVDLAAEGCAEWIPMLTEDDITDFAQFLQRCGGFTVS